MSDEPAQIHEEGEVVNGVAVLAEEADGVQAQRPPGGLSPATVQTVAVVGAGVMAGAAAVAIVHRRRARRMARRRRRIMAPVLASRSFLVDVHMLGDRK
ncbi:MAG: hypothetical protein QOE11_3122 [Solirubrobacteraceae bacterium]|jgi:hypothetical protein|nr:hypothetical protein [Solirubrobacteraceae bacterium]